MTNMEQQLFVNEISCNFNLRKPKIVNKPTNVYCVIYVGGKQHYFATGLKVLPSQWDKKKQIAITSNIQSTLDNRNNQILNDKISQLRGYYKEYIEYLCNNPDNISKLNDFIYKSMLNKKTKEIEIKATELLERALEIYIKKGKSKTVSTLNGYKNKMKSFTKYIKDCNIDDSIKLLTQRGLNSYQDYLLNEATKVEVGKMGGGKESINQKCQFIAKLINEVLCCTNDFMDLAIQPVKYIALKRNKKNKEEGVHFPLDDKEIKAFGEVTDLNEKQIMYRDLFLLQCKCGQRVSDFKQLLVGNYTVKEGFIHLLTQKEKIEAFFPETEDIKNELNRLKGFIYERKGFCCLRAGAYKINIDKIDGDPQYNTAIKYIAEKANLNRIWTYKDAQDRPLSNPIHKLLSSHCARHTFATIMRAKGYKADEVCLMLGHSDDTMVNQVYAHNDEIIKTKKLKDAINRVEGKIISNVKQSKTNALQELFAYDKLKELERMKDSGLSILPLSSSSVISIIKDTGKLKKAIQLMDKTPKEKQEEFINKVKEIDKIIWYIGKHTADTALYNIYEYKCKELGIIDKITDANLLDAIWQEELLNEEIEYYSDEALVERHLEDSKKASSN